jgi:hypothetical protein
MMTADYPDSPATMVDRKVRLRRNSPKFSVLHLSEMRRYGIFRGKGRGHPTDIIESKPMLTPKHCCLLVML